MVADDFVSLHTHTHASRFDGLGNAEQFVERAHELGQTAISFTEHGNLCGLYEQHRATLKGNMKLLPGVEAYLADDAEQKGLEDEEKAEIKAQYTEKELQAQAIKDAQRVRKERDHITVWAQTQEGLRNLYRLTSWSWNEGFYCLLPGQEIMTSSGVKPVEEIEVGDRVLTHKGRLKRVESTFSRPFDGKIYGIKLNNRYGRITWMTGEHPVLIRTRDGKVDWVRADEVKGGRARKSDSIDTWASFVCLPKVRPETEVSTVKISDWAKSWDFDGQTFSKEIPRQTMPSTYSYFRCDDEISLDYEFGMFLGLFCAEGGYDRENGFEFSFHQQEIGFIELVKKVLRDKFGLEATSNTREDRPGYKGISLRVYSQVVTEFMLKMCGRGSANMHLPPFSFESPKEFRRGLLDGIFGGDAAENDSATIFAQTSRTLSWQVRSLAAGFYESFPCVVETHDGDVNHAPKFRTNYAPRGPRRAGRHTLADDSYVYRPIAEVLVRDYAGPVFNFGVEEDESYVSDFAMHNCKPRIDIKRLSQFGKGLAVSTGCPGGVITSPLRAGKTDEALRRMAELSDIFGDRLYVEIMPHQMADCPDLASRMVKLADRFGCQVLATQDAHYPRPGDAHPQEVLLCINTRDRMSRPPKGADCTDGRFCFDHQHYYLRGRQEMAEALRKVPGLTEAVIQKSLDNTVDFADRVRLSMYDHSLTAEQVEKGLLAKPGEYLVAPELPPEHKSYDRWLISLITDACKARWGLAPMQIDETYRERLLVEMGRIIESGFSRYFIAVWEMIDWARKAGIMVGPGRGSVGGSLVAHLIGLSTLDPIRHGLSFDRFIGVGRCFVESSPVLTSNGYKKIQDIVEGELVATRAGFKRVVATHRREVNEDIVRVHYLHSGSTFSLRSTDKHRIFMDVGGNHEEKEADSIAPGEFLCTADIDMSRVRSGLRPLSEREEEILFERVPEVTYGPACGSGGTEDSPAKELQGMWEGVRSDVLEPLVLLPVVQQEGDAFVPSGEGVPPLLEAVQGQGLRSILLEEMWSPSELAQGRVQGQDGVQGGHRDLRQVFSRSGLREASEIERRRVRVRGPNLSDVERCDLHSGLLHPGAEQVRRVEGLGGPGRGEADLGEGGSDLGRLLVQRDLPEAIQGDGSQTGVRPGGTGGQGEFAGGVQDDKANLRPVQEGVRGDSYKADSALFQHLFEQSEDQAVEGDGGGVLRCSAGRVVSVHRERYAGYVYDLTVEDCHEYVVNGVLVHNSDYPDIDTDFDYRRRGDVIRHLQELYGQDRVALIGTLNTYGGKAALNEVGKVNGLAGHEVAAVTGLIVTAIEEENQDDGSLRDVLAETEAGQDFANRYPDVVSVATRLEGLIRAAGVHAAGVVISSHPLADIVPLESRPRDDGTRMATIAWPMEAVEAAGLVKLDALGLTTLGWLSTALEWVERNGTRLDLASLPLDDQKTLDLLTRNEFVGVFQYDTPGSRRLCANFTFTKFDDIAVMTALNRPGPTKSGLAQMYLDRAADPSKIPVQHPAVAAATADTLGCLIYQEQVVAVAAGLCGYDPKAADDFRKKISKKKGLSDELEKFIAGAQKNGMEYEEALEIFNEIKEFAAYCFNRAHAYSYGLLAYWTAYMKVHYPAEFYCGALANENRPERQVRLAQDARRAGIPVGAPEINTSGSHFAIRRINGRDEIVGAAVDLKGIGQKATDAIVASQPFESIVDFARRTDRAVTAKTFEILAKATAFRYLFPHARYLAENAKAVFADAKKGFEPAVLPESYVEWTDAEAVTAATSVYPLYVGESGLSTFELDERAARGRLKWPLYPVGDEELDGLESALVFGRVQQCKLYPEENGRSGRATLLGWDGTEIAAKMDVDVVDRYYDAVKKAGVHVVGLVRFFRGRASADAFWKVSDLDTDTCQVLQWLQSPGETDPADPVRIAQKRRRGDELVLDGLVVRRREHVDKKGGKMATLGIMAQRSYVQALVFSRDWADLAEAIQFGGRYAFRAEKLDGGGLRIDAVINDSGDRPRRRK